MATPLPDSTPNKRRAPRQRATFCAFRVATGDGELSETGKVVDVSESGLGMETHRPFPPGTELRLELMLPSDHFSRNVRGRVAWCQTNPESGSSRLGVEFVGLTALDREALRDNVANAFQTQQATAPSEWAWKQEVREGVLHLDPRGALDPRALPYLKAFLAATRVGQWPVVLNLRHVAYVSSACWSAILAVQHELGRQKRPFALVVADPHNLKAVQASGLHQMLHIASSETEAARIISAPPKA